MRNHLLALAALALLAGCSGGTDDTSGSSSGSSTASAGSDTGSTGGSTGSVGATGSTGASGSTGSDSGSSGGSGSTSASSGSSGSSGATGFKVRGSVNQIMVWSAAPATALEVHDSNGATAFQGTADSQGSLIFRQVAEGDYTVVAPGLTPPETEGPVHVSTLQSSQPATSLYTGQTLHAGFNYITTRDGTTLSAYVTFPAGPGPYPTVVNYSGYNPSQPGGSLAASNPGYAALCGVYPVICDTPADPSAEIAAFLGYATVGVNMRGTGCSGGAYDFFEDPQLTDGYDIIETVAAQSWVKGNKVGMTGLSYPGISQLFVAKTQPPHLAAITPLSTIGGTHSTALPGGIFNDGFALSWITNVVGKAVPYGQGWEQGQVDAELAAGGSSVCQENQLLHSQAANVIDRLHNTHYYDDYVASLDPTAFVHEIDVPVFFGGSQEDEQTGPYFFTLLDQFTGAPHKRLNVYNGVHVDGFDPQMLVEWKAFLDLYVAEQPPRIDATTRALAPQLFATIFGANVSLPPDRYTDFEYPDGGGDYAGAKAFWEAQPPVRAIFENGGSPDAGYGAPQGTFELTFDAWPPEGTVAQRWYFQTDGSMTADAPTDDVAASSFYFDPDAGHRGILDPGENSDDVWQSLPTYHWRQADPGSEVAFESAALTADEVMLGTGSADLWIRSHDPITDADLQVNLSEVRPDGQEMYIQSGWLRASFAALASTATALWPDHTFTETDVAPLVPETWTAVRVGIPSFNHVFRAGSKIRLTVNTPGGTRAAWTFDNTEYPDGTTYDVAHDAAHPSSLALPVLDGVASPTPLPPCPSLRGKQCRTYQAYTNVPAAP